MHFFQGGSPNTSQPASPTGRCGGPTPHRDLNPRSVTGVFADGTFGPFEVRSGNPVTLPNVARQTGRHLSLSDTARLALPDRTYTDQEILLAIRSGMPDTSWLGVILRAADDDTDFAAPGGTQSMIFLQKQAATGQVRVNVHDGTTTAFTGPWIPQALVDSDARGMIWRITTTGDTIECTLNGFDVMGGGYTGIPNPAAGGYTSLRSNFSGGSTGAIGIDYCLIRAAGDIPDVYFDATGKLWLSALEDNLLLAPTWQPDTFAFHHEAFSLGLTAFLSGVMPFLDSKDSDEDHFLLGVVDSGLALPAGTDNVLEYKGQREGGYQP